MGDPRDRALAYPYAPVERSITLTREGDVPFESAMTAGRTPVLAIGSNRAPEQLRRKFPDLSCLPLQRVELLDHDVVYAARVSGYGAMPATLVTSPGTCAQVAITWLTPEQLDVMDASEGLGVGYYWCEIPSGSLRTRHPLAVGAIGCYVAARGAWSEGTGPIALEAVHASQRRYPALNSHQVLARMGARLYPADPFEEVLSRLVLDGEFRAEVRARLGEMGVFDANGPVGRPQR